MAEAFVVAPEQNRRMRRHPIPPLDSGDPYGLELEAIVQSWRRLALESLPRSTTAATTLVTFGLEVSYHAASA